MKLSWDCWATDPELSVLLLPRLFSKRRFWFQGLLLVVLGAPSSPCLGGIWV